MFRSFCKFASNAANNRCVFGCNSISEIERSFHTLQSYSKGDMLSFGLRYNRFIKNSQLVRRHLRSQPKEWPSFEFTGLGKPVLFTAVVCGFSFAGAVMYSRNKVKRRFSGHNPWQNQDNYDRRFGFRDRANGIWNSFPPGQKLVAGIIAANVLIFAGWRVQSLLPSMIKYFTCSPLKGHPVSAMLFSTFSHHSGLHLFFNMYVFWSLATPIVYMFRPEEFVAFYLSAGVLASLTQVAFSVAVRSHMGAVGASGALFAVIGAVSVIFPQAQFKIAIIGDIIPHSFSASSLSKALLAFDLSGVLFRWATGQELLAVITGGRIAFGHAAHLGGIVFGILYAKYGHQIYQRMVRKR